MVNHETLQAEIGLLHVFLKITNHLTLADDWINFTIQEYFFLLYLFLCYKRRLRNRLLIISSKLGTVVLIGTSSSTSELIGHGVLLLFISALDLTVRLAIIDHLVEGIIFLKDWDNILVMEVLNRTRVLECPILQAVVLEFLFLCSSDVECLHNLIILQLKWCLSGAIL